MRNLLEYYKDHYLTIFDLPRAMWTPLYKHCVATATTTVTTTTATPHDYEGQRLPPDRWCPIGQPTNMAVRPTGNLAKWCNKDPPPGLGGTTLSGGSRRRPDKGGKEYHEGLDPQGLTNASRISHHTMLPPISRCDAPNAPPPSMGATRATHNLIFSLKVQ